MKFKNFLIFFLISMIAFTEVPKAIPPYSNTYKQGLYIITDTKEFNATAELTTPNKVTSITIFDSNGNPKFYKKFDAVDQVVNISPIKYGDIIVIIGSGEIASIITDWVLNGYYIFLVLWINTYTRLKEYPFSDF